MSPDRRQVLLQDVLSFVVRIWHPTTNAILGTGVLVNADGLIVTCAHVLSKHGLDPRQLGTDVGVYFPERADRPSLTGHAQVVWTPDGHGDDFVCLRTTSPVPVPPEKVAVLGTSDESDDHRFHSYGFRDLEDYVGGRAAGRILGHVLPPENSHMFADPVQLKCSEIRPGMSGAPVLDVERNLVVGIIAQAWVPSDGSPKDRDTGWAVDAKVLHLSNLNVPLRSEALTPRRAEKPPYDQELVDRAVRSAGRYMGDAPTLTDDWVGREPHLAELDHSAHAEQRLVLGLIGLGGEGKSTLARHWVGNALEQDEGWAGMFWWSCTARASADEFLDALIDFMSGGSIDTSQVAEGGGRPAVAFGMMTQRRYLIVLDGLEMLQHKRGDRYASLLSEELRKFLQYAATPGSNSLVVVTSRLPVLDLASYLTYREIEVGALTLGEGRELLRLLGVVGSDAALNQVVADWDGHALTLSLIATYLKRSHDGDVRRVTTLPPPQPDEPRDAQVRRVLREYDEVLTDDERTLLQRISIFRTPVEPAAVRAVVDGAEDASTWAGLQTTVLRYLTFSRIIRRDSSDSFSMHPLVRDFYAQRASRNELDRRRLHRVVKGYYLRVAQDVHASLTLDDLVPVLEAVHHAAASGEYDEACDILYERVYLGERGLITRELNGYETLLSAILDLFPDRDLWAEPLVTNQESRAWILHEVATALQLLGRLTDASAMFRRAIAALRELGAIVDAGVGVQNLTELYLTLGALPACRASVNQAFEFAPPNSEDALVAETLRGSLAHLEGRSEEAGEAFANAIRIAREITPVPALYSASGVRYAEHLRRSGQRAEAKHAHELNLTICRLARWQADVVHCLVGLGDLALDGGDFDDARSPLDEALQIAKSITRRDVLVSALRGRGALASRTHQLEDARQLLEQARSLAQIGDYKLAEADVAIELARLYHRLGEHRMERDALNRADQISISLGYHWGTVDAAKVRDEIGPCA